MLSDAILNEASGVERPTTPTRVVVPESLIVSALEPSIEPFKVIVLPDRARLFGINTMESRNVCDPDVVISEVKLIGPTTDKLEERVNPGVNPSIP